MKTRSLRKAVCVGGWCLLTIVFGAFAVSAQDCDRPADLAESGECAKLRLRAAERDMLAQMRLVDALEDDEVKRAVAAAQDAWLKYRDAEGEVVRLSAGDAALGRVNSDAARAQLTEDRVRDLRTITGQ